VGAVQTAGRTIAFGALGVTRMACPPPQMVLEARFLEALGTVANWEIQAESLAFFGGKEALVFDSIQIRTASVAGS
jgi:heat shock protein HslJ